MIGDINLLLTVVVDVQAVSERQDKSTGLLT